MRLIRVIFSRLLAFALAANLLISISGVPLQYCLCGDEVSMVKLALSVDAASDDDCGQCEMSAHSTTPSAFATSALEVSTFAVSTLADAENAVCESSCCHAAEQPTTLDVTSSADASDMVKDASSGCHREFHIEQLHTDALLSSIAIPSNASVIVAVLPVPNLEAQTNFSHSPLYASLVKPPPLYGSADTQALLCSLLI